MKVAFLGKNQRTFHEQLSNDSDDREEAFLVLEQVAEESDNCRLRMKEDMKQESKNFNKYFKEVVSLIHNPVSKHKNLFKIFLYFLLLVEVFQFCFIILRFC